MAAEASPNPARVVECEVDEDCDNGFWCTLDTCVDDFCQHEHLCVDDQMFCNGNEVCCTVMGMCDDDDDLGNCGHTGCPCPGGMVCCDEENDTCHSPPTWGEAECVGSRYIAITPEPLLGDIAIAFRVTSPDWPCLDKYVGGFLECGDTGKRCLTDADCNWCVGGPYDGPCVIDEDCKTCAASHSPCQTNDDCGPGDACVQVQACQISGNTCAPHLPLAPIDVSDDDLADGLAASLVDHQQDAVFLTLEQWGALMYKRCSVTFDACQLDQDCDVGMCSISGNPCSYTAQDCRATCTISGHECEHDYHCCQGPEDTCTAPQTCNPHETCMFGRVYVTGRDILPSEASHTTTYRVQACCDECNVGWVTMWPWADTDDNGVVNMADVQSAVLGFKHEYFTAIPPRTLVGSDLVGAVPCLPDQGISFDDIQHAVLAFKGTHYDPDVLAVSDACDVPCP